MILLERIKKYFPQQSAETGWRDKLLVSGMAFLAVWLVGVFNWQWLGTQGLPYLIASVGASAVLLFAVPKSPLSQPWPLLGGHFVSAVTGVASALLIEDLSLAAAVAVGLSILLMYLLRCLHPPGGAAAMGAVLGGDKVAELGFAYVLTPVMLNIVFLFFVALLLNRLLAARTYPALAEKSVTLNSQAAQWALGTPRFTSDDLHKALQEMDGYVDVSENDLARVYTLAIMSANKRRLGVVSCADIMSTSPLQFAYETPLADAWQQLRQAEVKGAPVVDSFERPLGMVTVSDFMHHAEQMAEPTMAKRFERLLHRTPGMLSDKPEAVGQIMSSPPLCVDESRHIVDLVPLFTERDIHHLPVVDQQGKLVGILTRSDVMRAMVLTRA